MFNLKFVDDILPKLAIIIGLLGSLLFIGVLVNNEVNNTKAISDQKVNELAFEKYKFDKEMILECQRLSATTIDDSWSYKSCISELKLDGSEVKEL